MNSLAREARTGCELAMSELYRYFIPIISRISRRIRHIIDDEVAFEAECYKRIEKSVQGFDNTKVSFYGIVSYQLRLAERYFTTRRGRQRKIVSSFESLIEQSDSKTEAKRTVSFVDDLAVIDDRLLVKEKIALLAKGDPKKVAILIAWSDGFYNESALSELLAQLFGGKPDSHRKSIIRFRYSCRETLVESA